MKITEDFYDVGDLYIIKLKENYQEKFEQEEGYLQYFNPSFLFIVSKFTIERKGENPYFFEAYMECITGEDLSKREGSHPFQGIPSLLQSIEAFPLDYLTEEERTRGQITSMRLFQIFEEINLKVKRLVK